MNSDKQANQLREYTTDNVIEFYAMCFEFKVQKFTTVLKSVQADESLTKTYLTQLKKLQIMCI